MGNRIGGKQESVVEERFTRPQGLYEHKHIDLEKLRKLILNAKLAPCYPGAADECPICFLYYPSLNRSKCCSRGICTECFLQIKPTHTAWPTQCPFCKTPNYAVEYHGVKTKEERSIEQFEEQKVIEAQLRFCQKEHQDEEVNMKRKQNRCSSSITVTPTTEVEYRDICNTSFSVPSYQCTEQGNECCSSEPSCSSQASMQASYSRHNRDDNVDMNLEDMMVMEAIWRSIQASNNGSAMKWSSGQEYLPKDSAEKRRKQLPQTMEFNILERILVGSEEPRNLDLLLLQRLTDNFSEQRLIGVGGCGEVYKGILQNGDVAIKRFFKNRTIKDKMFHREVQNLFTVRHENIVRLLGYCSFTEELTLKFKGKIIMADVRERLLCLEYISNGSLENHLTDELRGLEWHTRYGIIVGICKGLTYLHKEKDIIHMDLKPANILVDDLMVPKITDFGLSRLDNNSQAATTSRLISPVYCAPEYIFEGKASTKSDIYSLGVIVLELVTGSTKEPDLTKVLRRWRHRWIKSSKDTPLGYQQVTKCLELAQRCLQIDPRSRPDIVDITQELNAMDCKDDQFQAIPCLDDMLGIEPLEIHFPFELDQHISHSIELTNDTDDNIAFMVKATLRHFCIEPDNGIVPTRSKCSVTIKMQAQVSELSNNHYREKITVLSTKVYGGIAAMDITGDMFIEKEGTVVDEVNVMVVLTNQH